MALGLAVDPLILSKVDSKKYVTPFLLQLQQSSIPAHEAWSRHRGVPAARTVVVSSVARPRRDRRHSTLGGLNGGCSYLIFLSFHQIPTPMPCMSQCLCSGQTHADGVGIEDVRLALVETADALPSSVAYDLRRIVEAS